MQAIVPHVPARSRPYAWNSILVDPDPPRVGTVTRIEFPLANPGPDEVIVERIEASIANFGIGVRWEKLPKLGPFHLPPDPSHIEHACVEWTPKDGGHRCVRATIRVKGMAEPCQVGRNLMVLDAAADEEHWSVPFRLGNPEHARAPLALALGGTDLRALAAAVEVAGRIVPLDQPIWLEPGEEVEALLRLHARTDAPLNAVRTLEGRIHGRLIDGIQVTVRRAAHAAPLPAMASSVLEPVGALA